MNATAAADDPASLERPGSALRPVVVSLGVAVTAGLLVLFMFAPAFLRLARLDARVPTPVPRDSSGPRFSRAIAGPLGQVGHAFQRGAVLAIAVSLDLALRPSAAAGLLAMPFVGCLLTLWLVAWLSYRRLERWSASVVCHGRVRHVALVLCLDRLAVVLRFLADAWAARGRIRSLPRGGCRCLLGDALDRRTICLRASGRGTGADDRAGSHRKTRLAQLVVRPGGIIRPACPTWDSRRGLVARRSWPVRVRASQYWGEMQGVLG